MRRALVAALGGLGVVAAQAATIQLSHFAPNPGVMPGGGWQWSANSNFGDPPPQRAWVNGKYGSVPEFRVTDTVKIAGRAGELAVEATHKVKMRDAAKAVASCLIGGGPTVCAAVAAAAAAYAAYRYYEGSRDGDPCAPNELCWDEGVPEETVTAFTATTAAYSGQGVGDTASEAMQELVSKGPKECTQFPWGSSCIVEWRATGCQSQGQGLVCTLQRYKVDDYSDPGLPDISAWYDVGAAGAYPGQLTRCPASVDFGNPAYSVPAGMPKGPDGMCPTARYHHKPVPGGAAGADVAAEKVDAYPPNFDDSATAEQWLDAFRGAIESGRTVPADLSTTGPDSQTGTPQTTTTTTPTGTTTKTVTPTYNYTYNNGNNTITVTTTTTTVIINEDGDETTVIEGPGGTPTGPDPQDPEDPCTNAPDRIGCSKYGQVPDEGVPEVEIPFEVAPQAGWGATTAACPAPTTVTMSGRAITFDNELLCGLLERTRPVVLAVAAFVAALIVVGGTREA